MKMCPYGKTPMQLVKLLMPTPMKVSIAQLAYQCLECRAYLPPEPKP